MKEKDLAMRALNSAQLRGATYADIRFVHRTTQRVAVKNGLVEALEQDESRGFGVRVIANGAWGFASSARLDMEEINHAVGQAVAIAKASAMSKSRDVNLGPAMKVVGTFTTPIRFDPFMVSMSEKIKLLLQADEEMRRVKGVKVAQGEMVFVRENKMFASTEESFITQEITESGCGIRALATNPASGEVQVRSYPNAGRDQMTRGYEFIEECQLAENAGRIAEEAVALLSAEQCPSYDAATVILDGSQVALQVHESCGHPIELDRVLGAEAAFAGTSFLTPDKLKNFRYGSELINITSDARIAGGLGTFGFDDEGVPAQKTDIVKDGMFVG
jgi:TldD protein